MAVRIVIENDERQNGSDVHLSYMLDGNK